MLTPDGISGREASSSPIPRDPSCGRKSGETTGHRNTRSAYFLGARLNFHFTRQHLWNIMRVGIAEAVSWDAPRMKWLFDFLTQSGDKGVHFGERYINVENCDDELCYGRISLIFLGSFTKNLTIRKVIIEKINAGRNILLVPQIRIKISPTILRKGKMYVY